MDQAAFKVELEVIGMDLIEFVEALKSAGFENQAEEAERQFNEQLKEK